VHARRRLATAADGDLDGRTRPELPSDGQRREKEVAVPMTVILAATFGVAST
jgi:hypothetical protein